MRRVACFLLLLGLLSCNRGRAPDPGRLLDGAVRSFRAGDLKGALAQARKGSLVFPVESQPVWHLKFALLECEFLLARDETKPAAEILSGLPDGIPDVRLRAYRRMLDGYLSLKTGEYRTASEALQEALALADAAGDGERKTAVLLILGNVRDSEGRLEEAEACWGRALEQARAGNDVFNEAAALNNIGVSNLRRYRFEEAAGCFEPVLRSAERLGANLMRAAALGNIALCRYEVGDFEQAIQLRRQANAIAEQAGARLYELQGIGELGTILLRSDRPAEAAPEYRRALDLARTLHEPHETVLWSAQLAAALIRTGQYKEAGTLNQQALASAEPVRDSDALNQARMNAADMAASLGQSEEAAGRYKDLIRRQETPAYFRWEAHAGLAAVYRKLGRLDDASAEYGNAIALIEHARSDLARQDSMISFLSQLIRVYREYVDFLVDRGEDEQALKIADSSRARVLLSRLRRADASPRTFTVRRLQEIAAAHRRVFLSYWVAPAHTYLWIISGKVFQRHTLPGNAELQKLVEAHRAILEEGWRDPLLSGHPAGRELFRTLILPVRDFIPKETQVVLIPDGPLHLLNLETLPVEDEKPRYWIDDVTVTVMQSLSSAADEQPARTRQTSSILLLGDPQPADPRFPRLRHAGVELASVCRHFPAQSVNLLTGLNATPDSYRESHPERYTWIHFACHANAMQASPLESAVILSQGRTGYKLFAGEILEESLNAELVTVSACRGVGIRSYSGEGLVGFAWAFLKAGARNVIAGLWDVSDRSTAMLMDDLYAGLQAGLPPPEALRQAKLHLLHSQGNFAKPFYWGPFQLYSRGL